MNRKVVPLQPPPFAASASEVAQHVVELQKHILKSLSASTSTASDKPGATLWFVRDALASLEKVTPLLRQLEKQAAKAYEESQKKKKAK